MRKFLPFVIFVLVVPTAALAQTQQLGVELTPFGAWRWGGTIAAGTNDVFGQDVDVADEGAYGILLNVPLSNQLQLELMADQQSSSLQVGDNLFEPAGKIADIDVVYYHAGLLWEFGDWRSQYRPFFVLSGGVTELNPDVPGLSSDNRFSGSVGGGVKVMVNRNIGLRLEGRGFWTNLDDRRSDDCFTCRYRYDRDFTQGEARVGLMIVF